MCRVASWHSPRFQRTSRITPLGAFVIGTVTQGFHKQALGVVVFVLLERVGPEQGILARQWQFLGLFLACNARQPGAEGDQK